MRTRPGSQSGFTLIELMVVLILIGIFSGLMFAEMRGTYEEALLRSTARKIISAANLASSKAVTLNRAHSLLINPGANRLTIRSEEEKPARPEEESLDSRIHLDIRDVAVSNDEESESDAGTPTLEQDQRKLEKVVFFPDGTADSREIRLRDRMGLELVLRISPATGRIRIMDREEAR